MLNQNRWEPAGIVIGAVVTIWVYVRQRQSKQLSYAIIYADSVLDPTEAGNDDIVAMHNKPRSKNALRGAQQFIQIRHIWNSYKADPDYGRGVADALELSMETIRDYESYEMKPLLEIQSKIQNLLKAPRLSGALFC